MDADKQKALEAAGWKFGSVDEFLGERTMSYSDKMRAEFEAWAESQDYIAHRGEGGSYWHPDVRKVWRVWQAAYAAGQIAERAELERRERSALEKLRAELRAAKFGRTTRKQKDTTPPAT